MSVVTWTAFGLIAWSLGFFFVMVLMRMAGDEDRAAARQEKLLDASSEVMVTSSAIGRFVHAKGNWRDRDAAGTAVAWHLEWRDAA